jgi:NADPH:quinone reductase-like Zn-dependent oxidoreductase
VRAFVLSKIGEAPQLEDIAEPVAGPGEEVLAVLAAGVNPVDLVMADAPFGADLPLPRTMGIEAVVAVDGQPAYAEGVVVPHGSFADQTVVAAGSTFALPSELDPVEALGFGISGLAGWLALEMEANVQPGETVIVLGATGPAGQVAMQAARLLGATRVVTTTRSESARQALQSRGADEVVVLGHDDDGARLLEATNGGADVIFDPLWGPTLVAALAAAKPGARSVSIGMTSSPAVELPFMSMFRKRLSTYSNWGTDPERKRAAFLTMAKHARAGELVIDVEVLSLDEAPNAWARQATSPHVKLVLTT